MVKVEKKKPGRKPKARPLAAEAVVKVEKKKPGRKPKARPLAAEAVVKVEKKKPGRKPKAQPLATEAVVKVEKKKPGRKPGKKVVIATTPQLKAVKTVEAVEKTSKRRGRPKKVFAEIAGKSSMAISGKTEKKETSLSAPVIQIRYPNGIKLTVSADIDLKRLKELIHL